jgi:hypothetical protein
MFLSESRDFVHLSTNQLRDEKAIMKDIGNSEATIGPSTVKGLDTKSSDSPFYSSLPISEAPRILEAQDSASNHQTDLWRLSSPLASWTRAISKERETIPISSPYARSFSEAPESLSIFGAWDQVLKPIPSPKPEMERWSIPQDMKSQNFPRSDVWSWNANLRSASNSQDSEQKEHVDPWSRILPSEDAPLQDFKPKW